ncbi:MAG: flavin reductase family protein [Alphaproteobacteria bacterium]|jgi:flavin reductase (DIM6/NTAB) family NADH-FMN oxidoreductase RutF|tara:strand:- start:59 stop:526 length:468 start_codon:yes stop_codon:yes gene_type:complete
MDKKEFIKTVSKFITGITIVTLGDSKKGFYGCTMNSFTSLSLNPPQILFCVDNRNSFIKEFKRNTLVNINILSDKQKDLSNKFASSPELRWKDTKFKVSKNDVPFFQDSLVVIETVIDKKIFSGDHLIIICGLRKIIHLKKGNPLVYFEGKYLSL